MLCFQVRMLRHAVKCELRPCALHPARGDGRKTAGSPVGLLICQHLACLSESRRTTSRIRGISLGSRTFCISNVGAMLTKPLRGSLLVELVFLNLLPMNHAMIRICDAGRFSVAVMGRRVRSSCQVKRWAPRQKLAFPTALGT